MSDDAIVFIVDDDEAVRQSTAWLIESIGLKVNTFVSADEFLENYNNESGCIVMDVRMPGMSGRRFFRHLGGSSIRAVAGF